MQDKGTKSQLTVSIDPFITDILQSYIPPQYLNTNNNIQFEVPHSTQFYNELAVVLATLFPLDGDPDNQQQQITEVPDQEEQFQPEPEQFDIFTHEFKVRKHLAFHESLDEIKPIQLLEEFLAKCDSFHEYDIVQSIVKYITSFPTTYSLCLVERIFYSWPQYITNVEEYLQWAEVEDSPNQQHCFDTYDSLIDSLEYEIVTIDENIHKHVYAYVYPPPPPM